RLSAPRAPPRHLHSFPTRRSSDLAFQNPAASSLGLPLAQQPLAHTVEIIHPLRCLDRQQRPEDVRQLPLPVRAQLLMALGKTDRSEEHTSELQSRENLVCRLLLEK